LFYQLCAAYTMNDAPSTLPRPVNDNTVCHTPL
jgi:hypothetical protein